MNRDIKHVSLRIDGNLLQKLNYIAQYEDRSLNRMMLYMVRKRVSLFEQEHGPIPAEDIKE